jgi:hypothetical protein
VEAAQHRVDARLEQPVVDEGAVAPARDDAVPPERRKLLGHLRLRRSRVRLQCGHRLLAVLEALDQPEAERVAEPLDHLGGAEELRAAETSVRAGLVIGFH